MTARRVTTLLLVVAQATTGVYLLVYLYRWQWNRALICGVFFLATEVLVIGRLILGRLRAIDERLAALPDERVHQRLVETRPEPVDRFEWLRSSAGRTNVFLPVLLGAGVLASGIAWAVEALARRTARPTMERSLAVALAPLGFPAGGFLAPTAPVPVRAGRPGWQRVALVLAVAAVAGGTAGAIDVVADATQTRPDRIDDGVTTVVDLRFRGERATSDPGRHATHLVEFCTAPFRRQIETIAVVPGDRGRARVVLDADLGEHGTTRLRGCLEDTTLERVQATVVDVAEVPAP